MLFINNGSKAKSIENKLFYNEIVPLNVQKSILHGQLETFFPKYNSRKQNIILENTEVFSIYKVLLNVSYDGTKFHGNQIQPNNITVEHVLLYSLKELILEKTMSLENNDIESFINNESTPIKNQFDWCGRTDKNVSAENMVCALYLKYDKTVEWYLKSVNRRLCEYVKVEKFSILDNKQKIEFSPRFHCISREYKYVFELPARFDKRVFDPQTMAEVKNQEFGKDTNENLTCLLNTKAKLFLKLNNMKNFCKLTKNKPDVFYERKLTSIEIIEYNSNIETGGRMFELRIESKSFLHNQIRRILFFILFNRKGNMGGSGLKFIGGAYEDKFDWKNCLSRKFF